VPGQLTDSLEALDLSEFHSRACEFGVAFLCDRKSRDKAPERNDSLAHVHVGRSPEAVWGKFALDSPLEEAVSSEPVSEAKFPASWENTGNFVRLGLRVRLLARNR
jgi:hypothetical protein